MNQVNPKALKNSKWTKVSVSGKEKHFMITSVTFDEQQRVTECVMEAMITGNEYQMDWRELKDSVIWKIGWK
ncbi:TIGR02450 family Trp-rich protein [Vibrio sp. HN007]|uniref:TIGR02450 family Trp-rich protein n=1 Tax=Vibrio iocasae TaxID=3098914 RepID=UPI0035D4E5C4